MVEVSRRSFLKAGAGITAAAGIATVASTGTSGNKVAKAASNYIYEKPAKKQWSKLHPEVDYGGAKIKYVEVNDKWLGTTQILGPVTPSSENEHGFSIKFPEVAKSGRTNTMAIAPLGNAIGACRRICGFHKDEQNYMPERVRKEKLPLPDPEALSMHMKDFCYFMRADEVGIGVVPKYFYYSELSNHPGEVNPWIEKNLPYAILFLIDMNLPTYWGSSGYGSISIAQSFVAYYTTGCISMAVAEYIRKMGYEARSVHSANYVGMMPVLLIAAGMGELSRTKDCTIHPRLGFRHKVGGVLTDLPLAPDKPIDFGLLDFCRICKKCADNCPSKSISFDDDPIEMKGYLRWNTNSITCADFRITNENGSSCGTCVKVCPWCSKEDSWFHELGIWVGSQGELPSTLLKAVDDMFGYGTEILPEYNWWIEWPELYPSGKLAP